MIVKHLVTVSLRGSIIDLMTSHILINLKHIITHKIREQEKRDLILVYVCIIFVLVNVVFEM